MRIALLGGSGFVGFHLIEFLSMKNIKINALVRNGSEHKILQNNNITSVSGDIKTESAITETIKGCDYVIYNIGILEESPKTGSTFKEMQYQGLVDVISHCSEMEIRKFILKDDKSINPKIVNEVARSYEFQLKNNKQRKYNLIDFVNRVNTSKEYKVNGVKI